MDRKNGIDGSASGLKADVLSLYVVSLNRQDNDANSTHSQGSMQDFLVAVSKGCIQSSIKRNQKFRHLIGDLLVTGALRRVRCGAFRTVTARAMIAGNGVRFAGGLERGTRAG